MVKKIFKAVKEKTLLCFSLKNFYVIFLLTLLPAIFIYFDILDYDLNVAFLILGVISFSFFIISIFRFKNKPPKIPALVLSLFFGFLGLRLVEFFLMGDDIMNGSEDAVIAYFLAVSALFLIYLFVKIFKNNYSGKIISVAALVLSVATVIMLLEISNLRLENREFKNQADRLFETIELYEWPPPKDWKDYSNYDYNFFFKYPPRFSEEYIDDNLSVETERVDDKIFNKTQTKILESLKTDYGDVKNDLLLTEFWQPDCIRKLNNNYRNFILCRDKYNSEKIYFIHDDQLVKISIEPFLTSEAEFNAVINSFAIY